MRVVTLESERNKYDHRQSLEMGKEAELSFYYLCEKAGLDVRMARPYQNTREHWDFMIIKNKVKTKVEVKAMKRIGSMDEQVQDKWVWIELHGVHQDDPGWLNGQADLVAFEQSDHFIMVKRRELKELVKTLILDQTTDTAGYAKYKVYSRPGRHDKITMIQATDLLKIWYSIWRKE